MKTDKNLLKDLFNKDEFEECLHISSIALENDPICPIAHEYKALSLFSLKRYEVSIPAFQDSIKFSSPRINPTVWRAAHKALKTKALDEAQAEDFWEGCNSTIENLFDDSRQDLINSNVNGALHHFAGASKEVYSPNAQKKLTRCVEILGGAAPIEESFESLTSSAPTPKIILVAGMGWSGSGAIFDYLSEFNKVVPVGGESPFISRGTYSLASIFINLSKPLQLREQLINFFYFNLLGFSRISNASSMKTFATARSLSLGKNPLSYFDSMIDYCVISQAIMQETESGRKEELFHALVRLVLIRFSIRKKIPEGGMVILDNVVPINKIGSVPFLERTSIYCCFRDPRSNYVALLREDPRFNLTIGSYINLQKKKIENLERLVNKTIRDARGSCDVHRVQFEEFILSETFRDKIADSLGLDLKDRNKHSRLRPWESMRNVLLHQEHQNQEEINKIKEEMSDYCFEPCIRPIS